jgi:asparagine synthase (glutamine-hydrolysing)
MLLYCLAVNAPPGVSARVLRALPEMARVYPQLDADTLWSRDFDSCFVAGMHNPAAALGRRRHVHASAERVTFFEGALVDPRGRFAGNDAAQLDRFWDQIPAVAEGQYVAVRASTETVELITDPVGMEQVYYARLHGGWLVANSVTLLLRIAGPRPIDMRAASFFLCQSWVGEDRTLREGIRVIPGGQHWVWRRGAPAPDARQYFRLGDVANGRRRVDLEELGGALIAQVKALGASVGRLECPITAGKDSRLLTALALAAGVDAIYFTAGDSTTLDVMAGQAIARMLGVVHEVRPYSSHDLVAAWEPTSRALLEQTDGLVSLWYLDNFLGQPSRVPELAMQLWGIGGEIARGYWNHPKVVLRLQAAPAYLSAKVAPTHGGLVRPAAHALVVDVVRRFAHEAREMGFRPTELPDVFEAAQSVPRGDGSRGRNSRATGDYFAPYCTRPWLSAAFSLSPARRMTEPLHHDLLRRLRTELHSPPLATAWRPQRAVRNLATMIALSATARLRHRVWPRPAPGPVHHTLMLETMLGELRARCLDRPGSSLWDLISRERFEELTDPDGSTRQRGRRIHGLYSAVTLFEYEALPAE